ncbi:MAG: bifunctional alpha,alpha-trehalose-phosphate synthase (UDP-forming)/trehalose-phosphatase [Deltaproteobacteria bacterium]|nr:bifunctional alpha,alpha-trehalose-phosphate synthase (UDP-forming)/trehalose-phosphatase [Deltaproteobacteria bacterium]MBW2340058.1 bifunctional alpha,alpha-trehalose-phosphate synthase (UDP-forming)/trehalose-phosphatase [Deltaproteobacteria bacterium]
MQRLLIISNRLPVSIEKKKKGLYFHQSAGGLATGLGSFYKSYNSLWIGWPGITWDKTSEEERKDIEAKLISKFNCYPVFLSQNHIEKYYYGFSNRTLWPLFHYFTQYVAHNKGFWETYNQVNQLFSEVICRIARNDDIIWIHDYHLMLLPSLVRQRLPDATIGFFHHIPFPSFEIFRLLPWRRELAEGLLGADVIGFHTNDYARHFLSSVRRLLGYEYSLGQIRAHDRIIRVDTFPMGIAYERFSEATQDHEAQKEVIKIRKRLLERKVILSVDRLDYTKGIPQRLEAFDTFLGKNLEYREKVIFILAAGPSRTQVEHYKFLKRQIDELVGRINGKYGTIGWTPIWYLYRLLPFQSLTALYSIADVCLVTPLRDGMNLIAKEYLATKTDGQGVLVLSEMAGAAKELGEAIIINPNNREQAVEALEQALTMPKKEQEGRNRVMQKRIQRYSVVRWAREFIDMLARTKELQKEMHGKILTYEMEMRLLSDYHKAKRRLLLLDYDGTLIPFFDRPEKARPAHEHLELLRNLAANPKNEVVLLSGRDKDTLEEWFRAISLSLVAEHGVWIKEKQWEMIEPLTNDWKEKIRPILELYMDRTPGSFIEEKEFSLVWHYRKTDSELSTMRVTELTDELINLTANLNLQILEGSKVVEVKNSGISKGRAALRWIAKEQWNFFLAIGDDRTDEDMFEVLPENAYSLKVGLTSSLAKFNLKSQGDVLALLQKLASGDAT